VSSAHGRFCITTLTFGGRRAGAAFLWRSPLLAACPKPAWTPACISHRMPELSVLLARTAVLPAAFLFSNDKSAADTCVVAPFPHITSTHGIYHRINTVKHAYHACCLPATAASARLLLTYMLLRTRAALRDAARYRTYAACRGYSTCLVLRTSPTQNIFSYVSNFPPFAYFAVGASFIAL